MHGWCGLHTKSLFYKEGSIVKRLVMPYTVLFHVACNCPLWIVILTNERSEIVDHLTVLACEQATWCKPKLIPKPKYLQVDKQRLPSFVGYKYIFLSCRWVLSSPVLEEINLDGNFIGDGGGREVMQAMKERKEGRTNNRFTAMQHWYHQLNKLHWRYRIWWLGLFTDLIQYFNLLLGILYQLMQ